MAASMKRGVMASRSSSSSSESSEDEQTQPDEKRRRLQDAAVTLDYLSDLERWGKSSKTGGSPLKNNLPSKRCADVNEHEDENPLGTTPEFRAFVSKKLSEKLERIMECSFVNLSSVPSGIEAYSSKREIEFCATEAPTSQYASWVSQDLSIAQEGVRLFSDSCHDLSHADQAPSLPKKPQKPRHPPQRAYNTASEGYSSKAERLAAVAVTADFLAQERAMWARLSQASQESSGKQTSASASADNVTLNPTTSHEESRKKKKKKEAREKGETDGVDLDTNTATEECREDREKDCGKKKKKRKREGDSESSVCASETHHTDQKLSSDVSDVNGEEGEPVKKKTKKADRDVSKKSVTDIENGICDEPERKKKKKKGKETDKNNICSVSDTNCTEESHSIEARGSGGVSSAQQTEKKKHKKHHR